jgi:hypothetical protein
MKVSHKPGIIADSGNRMNRRRWCTPEHCPRCPKSMQGTIGVREEMNAWLDQRPPFAPGYLKIHSCQTGAQPFTSPFAGGRGSLACGADQGVGGAPSPPQKGNQNDEPTPARQKRVLRQRYAGVQGERNQPFRNPGKRKGGRMRRR